jgi:hypothetical protein
VTRTPVSLPQRYALAETVAVPETRAAKGESSCRSAACAPARNQVSGGRVKEASLFGVTATAGIGGGAIVLPDVRIGSRSASALEAWSGPTLSNGLQGWQFAPRGLGSGVAGRGQSWVKASLFGVTGNAGVGGAIVLPDVRIGSRLISAREGWSRATFRNALQGWQSAPRGSAIKRVSTGG